MGFAVGFFVGRGVGFFVGNGVGFFVGLFVGFKVILVGLADGLLVVIGFGVANVGLGVGGFVGESVGDCVGFGVLPIRNVEDADRLKLPPPETKIFLSLPLLFTKTTEYFPLDPKPSLKSLISSMVKS